MEHVRRRLAWWVRRLPCESISLMCSCDPHTRAQCARGVQNLGFVARVQGSRLCSGSHDTLAQYSRCCAPSTPHPCSAPHVLVPQASLTRTRGGTQPLYSCTIPVCPTPPSPMPHTNAVLALGRKAMPVAEAGPWAKGHVSSRGSRVRAHASMADCRALEPHCEAAMPAAHTPRPGRRDAESGGSP